MTSETDKKDKHNFLIRHPSANISVTITNGELSYLAHWGSIPNVDHDLKKQPNWDRAELWLEYICEHDSDSFFGISKVLNQNSRGYRIVKAIIQKQIKKSESEISKIMEKADFWRKFL